MTICGLIAHYGDEDGGIDRSAALIRRGEPIFKAQDVTVRDLSVSEFAAQHDEMLAYVAPPVKAGKIKYRENIRQGLETIPTAFTEMLRGENFGKMLVQVSADATLGAGAPRKSF